MFCPGLIRGQPVVVHRHPTKYHADTASCPITVAWQVTVASPQPQCVAPVAAHQPASSSARGASFVAAPSSRTTTPGIQPNGSPSRAVPVVFHTKTILPPPQNDVPVDAPHSVSSFVLGPARGRVVLHLSATASTRARRGISILCRPCIWEVNDRWSYGFPACMGGILHG